MKSNRLTVIDKENISIDMEYDDTYMALHINRLNFNKDTYLDMIVGISQLNDFVKTVGYQAMWAVIGSADSKTQKLAEKLGFKFLGEAPGEYSGMYVYQYEEKE